MFPFEHYPETENTLDTRLQSILDWQENILTRELMLTLLSCIDLTSLEGSDTPTRIQEICARAKSIHLLGSDFPDVAAVCFYPPFIGLAKKELAGSNVKTASVAGAFPSGQSSLAVKLAEVHYAVEEGADEIDTVISRGAFLDGEYSRVFDELAAIRQAAQNVHLKVILETGELNSIENVRKATEISIQAGADFVKTSTGKVQPAATGKAFLVMADTVKEYYLRTGQRIGLKPAGGISTPEQAFGYYLIAKRVAGEEWLNKNLFRIGASKLTNQLIERLK